MDTDGDITDGESPEPRPSAALPPPPPRPPTGPRIDVPAPAVARPVRELGRAAQIAVGASSAIGAASALTLYDRRRRLVDFRDGGDATIADLIAADDRVQIVSILWLVTSLVALVVFVVWFHRAYKNLAGRGHAKHRPGWAIGAWFVPFLNLWRPAKMTQELLDDGGREGDAPTGLMWTWWWAFVISRWIDRGFRQTDTIDEAITSDSLGAVSDVLWLVAGVLVVVLIGRITTAQTARAAAV